ncbi:MAG: hypothetical protein IBJ17_00040 [Reyranella sp.]|nr:hypothetical protein [Reyranella sp.]
MTDALLPPSLQVERRIATTLLIWLAAIVAAASLGLLTEIPVPLFGGLVAISIALPTATYFFLPALRAWAERVGVRSLTLLHVWRIPAALVFFEYGAAGLLPAEFVRNAAWGDLAAGMLAAIAFTLPEWRAKFWAVNLFGFADFVVAVGTGLLLSLMAVPLMENIATFPLVLIPLFGVSLSGAAHIITLDLLRRGV